MKYITIIAFVGIGLAFSGCGGGGSSGSSSLTPSLQSVPVQLKYFLPTSASSSSVALSHTAHTLSSRRLQYISPSNTELTITVTPLGGSPTVFGPTPCTVTSCTVSFNASSGPTSILFNLTDGVNTLSTFSTFTFISPMGMTTLNFTANPVVNSVAVNLAATTLPAGVASNVFFTVNAKDADGNTIVGPGQYVDPSGNPMTISLTTTDVQASGNGSITLQNPVQLAAPAQTAMYAHYSGGWLDHTNFTVNSTLPVAGALTGATLSTVPQVSAEYTAPTSASGPYGITTGPDGRLWFSENSADKIAAITTGGTCTEYPLLSSNAQPQFLISGSDGNIWFAETKNNTIGKISVAGAVTEYPVPTPNSQPQDIAAGSDGRLWFTEYQKNQIGAINTDGTFTEYKTPASPSAPENITLGPDNRLWFTESKNSANNIGAITPSGLFTEYPIPTPKAGASAIRLDGTGNVWFAESAAGKIARITQAGSITEYSSGLSVGATPGRLTLGPDGNMWFVEVGSAQLGRITPSGSITEYTVPSANAQLEDITRGPDGNLWLTEKGANKIAKFVY